MEKTKYTPVLIVLFVGVLMGALDISIVGPAIPSIEETIKIDERLLGWIFSIYVLFNLVGISLFAKLSDIYGRRDIYIVSIVLFSIGSIVVAISNDFSVLLIGRAIQGFGASGIFPVASAVVGDIFPPEKRGRILGIIGAVFGLAFIIGPLLAGTMLSFFSWNMLFLINIPIAVFLIIGSIKFLSSTKIESTSQLDWKGILLLGLTLSCFVYGINRLDAHSFPNTLLSLHVYPFLLAAIFFFILFISVQRNAASPIIQLRMFKSKQIRLVGIIAIGTGLFQSSFVFIPNFLVHAFDISSAKSSFMLVPLVLATAIGSPISGRLLDKVGSRLVIIAGLALAGLGYFLLCLITHEIWLFYLGGAFIGFGLAVLSGSALRFIMLNESDIYGRASSQGLITIFISIGQMTGSAIIGVILASVDSLNGYNFAFLTMAVFGAILFISAFFLKSRNQELIDFKSNT